MVKGPEIEEPVRRPRKQLLTGAVVGLTAIALLLFLGLYIQSKQTADKVRSAYESGYREGNAQVDVVRVEEPASEESPVEAVRQISAEVIRSGLRDIGELVTQEYNYTAVGTSEKAKLIELFGQSITLPGTTTSCIYSYDGIVKAGVDFTAVSVRKDDEAHVITLSLPHAKIVSSEFVPDSFELYDESSGLFASPSVQDFDDSNAELRRSAEQRALRSGLLLKAEANAETLLRSFLHSLDLLTEYEIIIDWTWD